MNFSLYIAKRYLRSKSSTNAINIITGIAAFGVVIGTAALFVVLSGFAGLKELSLEFTSFSDPDLKLLPKSKKVMTISQEQYAFLENHPEILSYSVVIEEQVLLSCNDKHLGVEIKGVGNNYPQATIDSILSYGSWLGQEGNQMVAGWGVSNNLGFGVLDYNKSLKLYAPKPGKGQIGALQNAFRQLKMTNVGVFQVTEELDHRRVYTSIDNARYLLGYSKDEVSAVELMLQNNSTKSSFMKELENTFSDEILAKNRLALNDALYKMLNTEYLAVYLIFTLILIIALFNIIGSVIMVILDKKKNIRTLYHLGATLPSIEKIFFLQGSLMTVGGGILGLILGTIIVGIQQRFGLLLITPSLPYPMAFKWANLSLVILTITVLGILASKIASKRISLQFIKDQAN